MISEHKFIKLRDGIELHAEVKEKGKDVWLIGVHGIGEHLGRHSYLQEMFGDDFNICQFDLRGHGRSQGERAYINDFDDFIGDLKQVLSFLVDVYSMERYFLFGHSMGSLIISRFVQKQEFDFTDDQADLAPTKVFLSAPPIGLPGNLGRVVELIPKGLFSHLCHLPVSLELKGLMDLNGLSHDPLIKQAYEEDELTCKKLHTRLVLEMISVMKKTFVKPLRATCPVYCAVGSEDSIVNVNAVVRYFSEIEKGGTAYVVDGGYHEMHNEISKYKKVYFDFLKDSLLEKIYVP